MRSHPRLAVVLVSAVLAAPAVAAPAAASPSLSLIVCAPGYPGNTEAAQPTMDAFAGSVAAAAGWKPGRLAAEYHQTLEGGLSRLARADAALALVDLAFFLTQREALGLEPLLEVTPASGQEERYTLVARRGAVTGPRSLAGWQVHGMHGYAPRFVRGVVLADWGTLPADVEFRFTSRVLASLRKAAAGEQVAVLLDSQQAAALSELPFAADLEPVFRSPPVVASVLCSVGDRLPPEAATALVPALTGLDATPEGRTVLESLRLSRFRAVDADGLRRFEAAFGATAAGP